TLHLNFFPTRRSSDLKAIKPVASIVGLLLMSIVIMPADFLERINHKFDSAEEKNSALSSREELWQARWNEFSESPVYGIGFGNRSEEHTSELQSRENL